MIITCNNCIKKFEIDSSFIPEKGRLLQCNGCNHKWFLKKEIITEPIETVIKNEFEAVTRPTEEKIKPTNEKVAIEAKVESIETEYHETIELLDETIKDDLIIEKTSIKTKNKDDNDIGKETKNKKNYNILGLTIVFIISFIALIIVLDTFQKPISIFIPNIELILYSLYETINDIVLFFTDLIL